MTTVIAGYARTPFVKYCGAFASLPATVLGGHAAMAALRGAGIDPEEVQLTIAGQVLQAAAGQNPARQSASAAAIPLTSPAFTVNAVCLSGMEAIVSAHRIIQNGEADVVLALGQESMTQAPHAWRGSRTGTKYGTVELIDTMDQDGLTDAFEHRSMGASTEAFNALFGIDRAAQDAWAAESHRRLGEAQRAGTLAAEIEPILIDRRGETTTIDADDGFRAGTTPETLARLRPAFEIDGTITAGNSSQLTDGAAAVVLVSERWAERHGIAGLARIVSHALVSGPDVSLNAQPANAITAALAKTEYTTHDLQALEINEAFATVAVHSTRLLGVDPAIVNANGGAIALGHPIGASGTRIVGHLARRLMDGGSGSIGAAGICGGGGQGCAVILEAL